MQPPQTSTSGKLTHDNEQTVDGRNPAPPGVYNTVQDFFRQQNHEQNHPLIQETHLNIVVFLSLDQLTRRAIQD